MCTILLCKNNSGTCATVVQFAESKVKNKTNNLQFVVHIETIHIDVFGFIAVRYSCCCSSFKHVILFQELMYLKLQQGGPNQKR
jgi:hypothetical protein